jgi:hypothetical protein
MHSFAEKRRRVTGSALAPNAVHLDRGVRGPKPVTQALNHGAGGRSLTQLKHALDHSPRVTAMTRLAAQLQRKPSASGQQPEPHGADVTQLVRYAAKAPIEGIDMAVDVVNDGTGTIKIVDLTKATRPVGNLSGTINYAVDNNAKSVILHHLDAQPGGVGLGSLLMYELADFAIRGGFKIISVATPALSAMGAYKQFGGRFTDPHQNALLIKAYYQAMQKDPSIHARFVKTEAQAMGEHGEARAAYFDPTIGPVGRGNVYIDAYRTHIREHEAASPDFARVAELKALSADLVYDPPDLLKLTFAMLSRKWGPG